MEKKIAFLKTQLPTTVTLSTYEFGEDKIQFVTEIYLS